MDSGMGQRRKVDLLYRTHSESISAGLSMLTLLPFWVAALRVRSRFFSLLCDFCTPHELGLSRELLALL